MATDNLIKYPYLLSVLFLNLLKLYWLIAVRHGYKNINHFLIIKFPYDLDEGLNLKPLEPLCKRLISDTLNK